MPRKKYFTEEERKEAARAASLRSYHRLHPGRKRKLGRPKKGTLKSRKDYWTKKARSLGLPDSMWETLFRRNIRRLRRAKKLITEDYRKQVAEWNKAYYERHKNDPEYKAKWAESAKKWQTKNREKAAEACKRWKLRNRERVLEQARDRYAEKKRQERGRLLIAL